MRVHYESIYNIGSGYVGTVTSAGLAELGDEVIFVDFDSDKVASGTGENRRSSNPGWMNTLLITGDSTVHKRFISMQKIVILPKHTPCYGV